MDHNQDVYDNGKSGMDSMDSFSIDYRVSIFKSNVN